MEDSPKAILTGVKFGRVERKILLELATVAKPARFFPPDGTADRLLVRSFDRAIKKLENLGMVKRNFRRYYAPVALTETGQKIFACFKAELELGKRIHWSKYTDPT